MRIRLPILLIVVVVLPMGCSGNSDRQFENLPAPKNARTKLHGYNVKILENADHFEVLSIDPESPKDDSDQGFRGFKVLGKTVVNDLAVRRGLVAAICKGVDEGTNSAWCFDPRHAVRVSAAGKSIDLLICFECDGMHVHHDTGDGYEQYPISHAAEGPLNKVLKDAHVPLALKHR